MKKRILVVDDEELITKSLLKLLGAQGYEVTVVRNGKEAIEKIKDSEFDLIISDVRMPDLDGVETIKQIRDLLKQESRNPIPEILITGYADKGRYEAAMDLKVIDYIYKPFDTKEFVATVKNTIG
jgi:CheY-like chemotaxis protein